MPKQLDNEKSSGKDKFRMSIARKAALGFIGLAGVVTGFNILGNAENPVREVPITESLDRSNFGVTGSAITTEAGKDQFTVGQKVFYVGDIVSLNFDKGAHYRKADVVDNGGDGRPSNDVRIKDLPNGYRLYVSNRVINPVESNDPNGSWSISYADGRPGFFNAEAASKAGALDIVKSYSGDNVANSIKSGNIIGIFPDGMLVQQYNEDGSTFEDPVAVGVTRIGDKNLKR